MLRDALETVASGVAVFAAGYVLWPQRHVYWGAVSNVVGNGVTVLIVIGLCVGVGAVVRRTTPFTAVNFAIGGLLASVVGMYLIEATVEPDSPVHLYAYGLMGASMIVGYAPREILEFVIGGFASLLDLSARRWLRAPANGPFGTSRRACACPPVAPPHSPVAGGVLRENEVDRAAKARVSPRDSPRPAV